jgi:cyclopropane fatty-acyl-phospholipid synthase-like methyltransferase
MTGPHDQGFDDAQAFWDQRYSAPEFIFGTEPNRFLVSQAALFRPGQRVLDIACGEGRNSVWLAQRGCRVLGIDVSPLALKKARRLADDNGVEAEFRQADVRQWPWHADELDAVVSIFIQFAAPGERAGLFEAIQRALKPGGVLVLQGYTPKQLEYKTGGPPQAAHMYTEGMLREAFAGMELLHLREHEDTLAEGTKHVGRSAPIDLVARKPA